MSIRILILAASLIPLAACSGNGEQSRLPASMTLTYDAGDASAAQTAADQCSAYGLKAVKADAKAGTVAFSCR